MKKKIISAALALTLIMTAIFMFGGCSNSLEDSEIERIYNTAVNLTFEQDVYFLKETVNTKDLVKYTQVNVRPSIDKKYNIEKNDDGSYKDLRIEAFEQVDGKETLRNVCGSVGEKSLLFTTAQQEQGNPVRSKREISSEDYYNSADFSKYRIEAFLDELNYLKFSDMDFSVDKAEAGTRGEITTLIFAPTEDYLERYERETGKKSVFEGCMRVSLEITYGKISHIIVYTEDKIEGTSLSVEAETYKLLITYYGPIINLPDPNGEDWKNA